jgi:hypothetical protein
VISRRANLLNLPASPQAANEEKINEEDDGTNDGDCTGGTSEIHAGGVWWPVVSFLRVTPVFKDCDGASGEKNRANEI